MMRLFVGIEIPETVRLRLSMVRGPLAGARWIESADMHVTLRFVGDIDNAVADELAHFLAGIELDPFEVRIADLGAFGGRDPRVLWAGVEGGEPLETLHRACERACRSAGLEAEPRSWHPHVTLARLRGASADQVARFLGQSGRLETEPFTIERFVLYSAKPKVGGGPYVVEEAYWLGG